MEKKIKNKVQNKKQRNLVENLLCLLIMISPILDMMSFLFRNAFHTNWSPSTFLRPCIPMLAMGIIFLKKPVKKQIIFAGIIYASYAIVHLILFNLEKTGSSYAGVAHEAQYLINYTFMMVNFFLYTYCWKEKEIRPLQVSMLIAQAIYITSIFISIITKTSSSTYVEGMGYKGWFESGNSVSSILILQLFLTLPLLKEKKYRYPVIILTVLVGIYLTTLIGTRVGLFGFILVLFVMAGCHIIIPIFQKKQLNKKMVLGSISAIIIVLIIVAGIGSSTIQRRKHLKEIEANIVEEDTNTQSHISGSLLQLKEKIDRNEVEEGYFSEAEKHSILDLYNIANKLKIANNDMRMQQLIYNTCLVANQRNPMTIFFGNGYLNNYRELVLEMEIPAFLYNFGIIRIYFILCAVVMGIFKSYHHSNKREKPTINNLFNGTCRSIF